MVRQKLTIGLAPFAVGSCPGTLSGGRICAGRGDGDGLSTSSRGRRDGVSRRGCFASLRSDCGILPGTTTPARALKPDCRRDDINSSRIGADDLMRYLPGRRTRDRIAPRSMHRSTIGQKTGSDRLGACCGAQSSERKTKWAASRDPFSDSTLRRKKRRTTLH